MPCSKYLIGSYIEFTNISFSTPQIGKITGKLLWIDKFPAYRVSSNIVLEREIIRALSEDEILVYLMSK